MVPQILFSKVLSVEKMFREAVVVDETVVRVYGFRVYL